MSGIKAIETRYAGCHFRSRLEARWAVFFDALSITWEYEPQGFEGAFGERYLPDFLLPTIRPPMRSGMWSDYTGNPECEGTFVEVKGSDESLRRDSSKIGQSIDYRSTPVSYGLLILGPVPHIPDRTYASVGHSFLTWDKGVDHSVVGFSIERRATLGGRELDSAVTLTRLEVETRWYGDSTCDEVPIGASVNSTTRKPQRVGRADRPLIEKCVHPKIAAAYTAARSARFEHGHSGAS